MGDHDSYSDNRSKRSGPPSSPRESSDVKIELCDELAKRNAKEKEFG